eukprot:TRINITY_DN10325_c0_g1_i2.p1 TRINITY_DN10325_c0_g1~~TRINITY_DN10325_c0_g1_i2.p1  ORF type:complete len:248 (-),score=46.59 TRINITY_DN10325_c0_g1_i2:167-880(-)
MEKSHRRQSSGNVTRILCNTEKPKRSYRKTSTPKIFEAKKNVEDLFTLADKVPPILLLRLLANKQSFFDVFYQGEEIGEGGFGKIFEAVNKKTMEVYAVKTINIANLDKTRGKMLIDELIVLQTTSHKNLVSYVDCFLENYTLNMVLENCKAGSLNEVYFEMQRPFTEEQIIFVCHEVLLGLTYLHKLGIIHRDIKGANILMTSIGEIKIADFGTCAPFRRSGRGHETFIGFFFLFI